MTTLEFGDSLVENTFSFANSFSYGEKEPYGLYFSKESQNYPFILKGELSDEFELEYCTYSNQLRGRLLNTKKIKEIMNLAKLPLYFTIKQRTYLIGKGFLSTFDPAGNHQLLFIACVDGMRTISSIEQVKFYVAKHVFDDRHKAVRTAVEDIIKGHTGDVIQCNNILDYVGERIILPRGGSLSELNKYKQAIVRTCLMRDFSVNQPLVVESNRGTVSIEAGGDVVIDPGASMDTSDVIRALNQLYDSINSQDIFTADLTIATDAAGAIVRGIMGDSHGDMTPQ